MELNLGSKLQGLLPGKLTVAPPEAKTNARYLSTNPREQPFLEFRLNEWLRLEHLADTFRSVRPPDLQSAMLLE